MISRNENNFVTYADNVLMLYDTSVGLIQYCDATDSATSDILIQKHKHMVKYLQPIIKQDGDDILLLHLKPTPGITGYTIATLINYLTQCSGVSHIVTPYITGQKTSSEIIEFTDKLKTLGY